jgi:hypothetical protein
MTTTNLAEFGRRELQMLGELLQHYAANQYVHPYWTNTQVQAMYNRHSGNVFLVDEDYNVLMMNGFKLEAFYTLPYNGDEGFIEDFSQDEDDYNREDWEYLQSIVEAHK